MKLQQIQINNLFSYGENNLIDLTGAHLALIAGVKDNDSESSNGTGKSAIFESLCWGLYGETKRATTKDGVVRTGAEEGWVSIFFEEGGKNYKVRRGRNLKQQKTSLNLYVKENGEFIDMGGAGIDDVQSMIFKITNMNVDIFRNSVFFGQGDISGFLYGTDKGRKDILSQILNLSFDLTLKKIKEEIRGIESKLNNLTGQLDTLRTFTIEENIDDQIKTLQKAISDKQIQLSKAKEELALKEGEYEAYKDKISKAENIAREISVLKESMEPLPPLKDIKELQSQYEKLKTEKIELKNKIETVKDLEYQKNQFLENLDLLKKCDKKTCYVCKQVLTEDLYKTLVDGIEKQLKEVGNKITEILSGHNRGLQDECNEITKQMEDIKQSVYERKVIVERKKKQEEIEKKIKQLEEEQKVLQVDPYSSLKNEIIDMRLKIEDCNSEMQQCQIELSKIKSKKDEAIKLQNDISSLEDSKKKLEEEREILSILEEAFGQKGIKAYVIENLVPIIEEKINYYLRVLTDGSIFVELETQVENKSKKIEDKFEIFIKDGVGVREIRSYSGGEKKVVEIAIRLALAELTMERVNTHTDFLLLDEIFENLDTVYQDKVISLLQELQKKFSLILVISHIQSVKDKFDKIILVEKQNGISRIIGYENK
jgi:exonuclease SbcC